MGNLKQDEARFQLAFFIKMPDCFTKVTAAITTTTKQTPLLTISKKKSTMRSVTQLMRYWKIMIGVNRHAQEKISVHTKRSLTTMNA